MIAKGQHFVTCGQMKILEERADESGLSYYQMMENAGTGAAKIIMDIIPLHEGQEGAEALVFCGKGNNGGDGFVVARLLDETGYSVSIVLVDGEPKTVDAVTNYELIKERNIDIVDMNSGESMLIDMQANPRVIVDAIYGTGFKGQLRSNGVKSGIFINSRPTGATVFALDIPSGLGGDAVEEEEIDDRAVMADYTITFHAKKPVHIQDFALKYCGEILVADIGIDEEKLMLP